MALSTSKKEFLFDGGEILTTFKSALENQGLIIDACLLWMVRSIE